VSKLYTLLKLYKADPFIASSRLRNHPVHLEPSSLLSFRHAFSDSDKLMYLGEEDDDTHFRFNCFAIEDQQDSECGLENGELVIPGRVLRRDVFDPVIREYILSVLCNYHCPHTPSEPEQVLEIIDLQLAKTPTKTVHALILVGGLSSSQCTLQLFLQSSRGYAEERGGEQTSSNECNKPTPDASTLFDRETATLRLCKGQRDMDWGKPPYRQ